LHGKPIFALRKFDLILAKAYLFVRAHLLNPLWSPRGERREVRRDALAVSLPWYFRRNLMGGLPSVPDGPVVREDASDKVFTLWFQGEENAPELVKACFRSMRRHFRQEVVVLDERTLFDYISLPESIVERYRTGKIKAAHFADICRVELLYRHGGYWLDSTCFATAPIPDWVEAEDFFLYLTEKQYGSVYSFCQNCFIRARKGSYLLGAWRSMILDFWLHQTVRMDYFQHQLMFKTLVTYDSRAAALFAEMPHVGQDATHVLGAQPLDTPYDPERFLRDTAGAFFQKLTYRGADDAPEGSVIDYIKRS